jgi:hypothetical protein
MEGGREGGCEDVRRERKKGRGRQRERKERDKEEGKGRWKREKDSGVLPFSLPSFLLSFFP